MNNTTKILSLSAILLAFPAFAADMNFTPKNDISLSGKIATVKTSKKFRNLESCRLYVHLERLVWLLPLIHQKVVVPF